MTDFKNIGKYQIVGSLGRGGMGTVYRAIDPVIQRTVALKIIRAERLHSSQQEDLVARFKNEARAAGRLNHPGIVAVYEFGEDGDLAYIAMEFVDGTGLRDYVVAHDGLSLEAAVDIMVQLLEALDYAHDQGILHRDIKPSNLLVTKSGRLKIADFGIARIDDSSLTKAGVFMGTPSYMAPEYFLGLPVDRRSDIFSAGVVFYELLTGHKPFAGPTEAIGHQICHVVPPAPSSIGGEMTTAFDQVVATALAQQVADRYPSAGEFCAALRATYEEAFQDEPSRTLASETKLNTGSSWTKPLHSENGTPAGSHSQLGWENETLKTVEHNLATFIGPVARVLVHKAAGQTTDRHELFRLLANSLDDQQSRASFLASEQDVPQHPHPTTRPRKHHAPPHHDDTLNEASRKQIAQLLTRYVGPIAPVLVKQAAQRAKARDEFLLLLAESLTDPEERRRFLDDVARSGY